MFQPILVPYDGSETPRRGLDEVIKIARLNGAMVGISDVLALAEAA